jgi:hypothetical protein
MSLYLTRASVRRRRIDGNSASSTRPVAGSTWLAEYRQPLGSRLESPGKPGGNDRKRRSASRLSRVVRSGTARVNKPAATTSQCPPEPPAAARRCVASGSCPAPENHPMSWVWSHFLVENRRSWGVFRASEPLCQKIYVKSKSPINGANPCCTIVYCATN